MSQNAIRVTGHLMATSYWHVTSGASDNITKVMRSNMIEGISDPSGDSPDRSPTISYNVPLVPANSVRGRLRRHTLSIITEAILARGLSLSKDAYQMLSNGGLVGSSGEKDSLKPTVGEIVRARRHLHFGLWGGGPRLMHSAVITPDLVPVCAETIRAGRVPPKLRGFAPIRMIRAGGEAKPEPATAYDLIQVRMFKKNDDMMQVNSDSLSRLRALGSDTTEIIAAYQAEQMAFREDRKQAKQDTDKLEASKITQEQKDALKKRDSVNFLEMETVIPGTVWPVDMQLQPHVSPAQIALFVRGLERFVQHQQLGGMGRWGFGQYRAYLEVAGPTGPIASLRWDDDSQSHLLSFVDDSYDRALADALSTFDPDEAHGFSIVKSTDAKPKRARASKAAATTGGDDDTDE